MAIDAGADALGLVSAMPSGPGVVADDVIAKIASFVPPPIATFLLTSRTEADAIIEQQRSCQCNTLQFVDTVAVTELQKIREALPGISLVQVIHVTGEESIEEALAVENHVDAILLDSGNPNLEVKELGGTGRTHNWEISRKIREAIDKPLFLAGGLKPENVAEAIRQIEPYGIDICSGVRTDGKLDADKLDEFMKAVQSS